MNFKSFLTILLISQHRHIFILILNYFDIVLIQTLSANNGINYITQSEKMNIFRKKKNLSAKK